MPNLSLIELKQIAKMRRIKGYKSMSNGRLLSAPGEPESAGSRSNFNNASIKKIREGFKTLRDRFLKQKIKEIRRNFAKQKTKRIFLNQK